jgi:large subunit ribosomal protein L10
MTRHQPSGDPVFSTGDPEETHQMRGGAMENPRPEKVAVVEEVRKRFTDAEAVLLTEYRGIDVSGLAELRTALRAAGGDYKVYKNTLVRRATNELGLDLDEHLTGPTAIAFVPAGGTGDPVAVAKALRDFAKGNPNLVVKGGLLGEKLLTAKDAMALANVAPREDLLAQLAGLIAAPMVQFAGLLQARPRDFAYGLAALIEKQGGAPEVIETPADEPVVEEAAAPEAEATAEAEAPAAEDTTETPEAVADAAAESNDAAPADAEGDTQES